MMQKILIIEDDHHILLMMKKMLDNKGFEITLASNGKEGLEIFNKNTFDLVITDIIMPEKEGLETIREMKRACSDLKIIAMSGGGKISADNYLETAKIFGASKLLEKPFTRQQLVTAVQEIMGESPGSNQNKEENQPGTGLEQENG
jgi:YesN/AraC family two-component response regulator